MTLKNQLKSDLNEFFNEDDFAEEVKYYLGSVSSSVTVQFFDQESDLGDSMMRKMLCRVNDLPNLSKDGYFIIGVTKFGVIDFRPDEENVLMQIILQKGMK